MAKTTYAIYANPTEGLGVARLSSCGSKVAIIETGTKTAMARKLRHTRMAEAASRRCADAFAEHPARESDPSLALTSAREQASRGLRGLAGSWDDETLTFRADDGIEIE